MCYISECMRSVSAEFPKLACECSSCGLSIMDVSNFEMHTQFSLHDSLPKSAHTTSSPHFSSERSSLYCNIADVNVSKWHKRWRIVGLIGTLRLRFLENRESQQVESNKNISTSCSVLPLCPSVLSLPYICLVQTRFFLVFNYWQNRVSHPDSRRCSVFGSSPFQNKSVLQALQIMAVSRFTSACHAQIANIFACPQGLFACLFVACKVCCLFWTVKCVKCNVGANDSDLQMAVIILFGFPGHIENTPHV